MNKTIITPSGVRYEGPDKAALLAVKAMLWGLRHIRLTGQPVNRNLTLGNCLRMAGNVTGRAYSCADINSAIDSLERWRDAKIAAVEVAAY